MLGSAGQDRGDGAWPAGPGLLGFRPEIAGCSGSGRDDRARQPGVSPGFARRQPSSKARSPGLTAHRIGTGWRPHKAKGPALAALASYYGHAQLAEDRYRLTVTVNDTKLAELNVTGATAGPGDPGSAQGPEGRAGQPDSLRHGRARTLRLCRHASGLHARLRGRPERGEPRRRGVAASLLPGCAGARRQGAADRIRRCREPRDRSRTSPARSRWEARPTSCVTAHRNIPASTPEWERDFLIVEEHLPAGTTLDRGLGEHECHVVRAGRRRAHVLLCAEPEPGRDLVRRLRISAGPVSRLARVDQERLRAGAIPSRKRERAARPASRRAGHRPVQADAGRALRPRQGPLRRGPFCRGRRSARAALRRLHASRRHRQGRRSHAAA